jgi:hypothetical protein
MSKTSLNKHSRLICPNAIFKEKKYKTLKARPMFKNVLGVNLPAPFVS